MEWGVGSWSLQEGVRGSELAHEYRTSDATSKTRPKRRDRNSDTRKAQDFRRLNASRIMQERFLARRLWSHTALSHRIQSPLRCVPGPKHLLNTQYILASYSSFMFIEWELKRVAFLLRSD